MKNGCYGTCIGFTIRPLNKTLFLHKAAYGRADKWAATVTRDAPPPTPPTHTHPAEHKQERRKGGAGIHHTCWDNIYTTHTIHFSFCLPQTLWVIMVEQAQLHPQTLMSAPVGHRAEPARTEPGPWNRTPARHAAFVCNVLLCSHAITLQLTSKLKYDYNTFLKQTLDMSYNFL